jgi:cytochrome c-type biogenesis protein
MLKVAISPISDLATSFVLGLLTPLGAVCVLPLYPGFLVYLASQAPGGESDRRTIARFGVLISAGVIAFMSIIGLLFTTVLEVSLTRVIQVVSPVAFGILLVISILLILDVEIGRFLPRANVPMTGSPTVRAISFGLLFGAIVLPCNPLFIAALFARTASTGNFLINVLNFVFFGIGLAFPLLAFSLVSTAASEKVIDVMTRYRRHINLVAGAVMLAVSSYYLVFVFRIFGGLF